MKYMRDEVRQVIQEAYPITADGDAARMALGKLLECGDLSKAHEHYRSVREKIEHLQFCRKLESLLTDEIERSAREAFEAYKHRMAAQDRLERLGVELREATSFFNDHIMPTVKRFGAAQAIRRYRASMEPGFLAVSNLPSKIREAEMLDEGGQYGEAIRAATWASERMQALIREASAG